MEVSVSLWTGTYCTVEVDDRDTVVMLKEKVLREMTRHKRRLPRGAASATISLRMPGGSDLQDDTRIADTPLQAGGELEAVHDGAAVRAPFMYEHTDITRLQVSPCGMRVAICHGGTFGTVSVWATTKGTLVWSAPEGWAVTCPVFSECGEWLGLAQQGTALILQAAHGSVVHVLSGHSEDVMDIAFSRCRSYVLTASQDATLRMWEVVTGRCAGVLGRHSGPVNGVAVTDSAIVSCSDDATVRVWDFDAGECTHVLNHSGPVRHVATGDVGKTAVSAGVAEICVWEVESGACLHKIALDSGDAPLVRISPAGGYFATSRSSGDKLRFWCLSTGDAMHLTDVTDLATQYIGSFDVTPCGRWLFAHTGGQAQAARVQLAYGSPP